MKAIDDEVREEIVESLSLLVPSLTEQVVCPFQSERASEHDSEGAREPLHLRIRYIKNGIHSFVGLRTWYPSSNSQKKRRW